MGPRQPVNFDLNTVALMRDTPLPFASPGWGSLVELKIQVGTMVPLNLRRPHIAAGRNEPTPRAASREEAMSDFKTAWQHSRIKRQAR